MEPVELSLGKAEREALSKLEPALTEHGLLAMRAHNLLSRIMGEIPEMKVREVSQSLKVSISLLIRLSDDLRSASLLALRGYATQAATLVASIYENALMVAYIGSDEDLAQQWIDHEDPASLFRPIIELTRQVLSRLKVDELEQRISDAYRVYRQLCMAKHSNPLYQMQHGYQAHSGSVYAMNGPDTSEDSIRVAWFALENAVRQCIVAGASFVEKFVLPERRSQLQKELVEIGEKCNELSQKAASRFGTKDPFSGKW